MANISTLIVGLRDKSGTVNRVESVSVSSLSKNAKYWDYNKCLIFLHAFLKRLKHIMNSIPEGHILVAERLPQTKAFYFKMVNENSTEYSFLTEDFKKHFS